MIFEIKTGRAVSIDPKNTEFTISQQAQMRIIGEERRKRKKVIRKPLPPGRSVVGPAYSSITYAAIVSTNYAEVISFASTAIATYRGVIFVPGAEKEIDRTSVEPGEYVPLAEERTALFLSLKESIRERGLRRVTRIRARYFVANISNSGGRSQVEPSSPQGQIPLSPLLAGV